MLIKSIVVGPLEVNCFIVADDISKKAIVVDPGDEPDRIIDIIKSKDFIVKYIICTHGHFDHVGAVSDLKKETDAKVIIHKDELVIYSAAKDMAAFWGYDLEPLPDPDVLVKDGEDITVEDMSFKVFHTPGHSPGSICLYSEGIVVTGDTIFAGSVGRTDFYGGDINKLRESFKRLMSLPENTRVLPGHGPETTIGREKRENMFIDELVL
ncbi:MBL fold hydrolase [Dissulfurispira thermophila]|uniref:MBL fold hydrolase n=2 Tax=root TaxID=1 RepID=A0A7G1H348_9BACT|nr:MBL fold metallo-hydrolase [Dissulfurispira thermophila]BCB97244.1 MBL fold hydrolase [Dissulfurispira thermophila]